MRPTAGRELGIEVPEELIQIVEDLIGLGAVGHGSPRSFLLETVKKKLRDMHAAGLVSRKRFEKLKSVARAAEK